MLSEGIEERQKRIEEFQEKIDKVMNDVFVIKWHAGYSSRSNTIFRVLEYILKQSMIKCQVHFLVSFENHPCLSQETVTSV